MTDTTTAGGTNNNNNINTTVESEESIASNSKRAAEEFSRLITDIMNMRKDVKFKSDKYLKENKRLLRKSEARLKRIMRLGNYTKIDVPKYNINIRLEQKEIRPQLKLEHLHDAMKQYYGDDDKTDIIKAVTSVVKDIQQKSCLERIESLRKSKRFENADQLLFELPDNVADEPKQVVLRKKRKGRKRFFRMCEIVQKCKLDGQTQ